MLSFGAGIAASSILTPENGKLVPLSLTICPAMAPLINGRGRAEVVTTVVVASVCVEPEPSPTPIVNVFVTLSPSFNRFGLGIKARPRITVVALAGVVVRT